MRQTGYWGKVLEVVFGCGVWSEVRVCVPPRGVPSDSSFGRDKRRHKIRILVAGITSLRAAGVEAFNTPNY